MIKYVHGSADSLDKDVFLVVDELPSFYECKKICDSIKDENANIIEIKDGYVTACYKGTVDEIQNSLLSTYGLHDQHFPLIISEKVKRNIPLKIVRVLRCFLSHYSRTDARAKVKAALQSSSLYDRVEAVSNLNMWETEFSKNQISEVRKVLAFQLAQVLGLLNDVEIYTKGDAAKHYPALRPYLYRENASPAALDNYLDVFIDHCVYLNIEEQNGITDFTDFDVKIDLKNEKVII
jgi:hypothetical protein